ncbi:MAG: hypothetical protein K5905_25660 [Roseibium sp.]|uniref:hypothetical protein n=1 Tax=Roseibium sp. TaxID=1936156 RepID=UPI002619356F|nr:hypothetical protein [Roseibium sp.]MCV0428856.1 hypothetical protein [Roseibium sp.]
MTDELPGLLGEIAEVAGLPAALAIAEQVGGTRVTIPSHAMNDHWLVELVGREAADKICDHFRTLSPDQREAGARHVIIPRGPAGCLTKARTRLAKELEAGTSAREAARRAGLTERTAWRMRAKLRDEENSKQGSLFQDSLTSD